MRTITSPIKYKIAPRPKLTIDKPAKYIVRGKPDLDPQVLREYRKQAARKVGKKVRAMLKPK